MKKFFQNKLYNSIFIVSVILSIVLINNLDNSKKEFIKKSDQKKLLKIKKKKARADYFFNMLRDPKTNSIPQNIRAKEIEFANNLLIKSKGLQKSNTSFEWREAGPNDVGGRTRALAVDKTNSNIIIAGGASGGIWKSTDGGNSWNTKSQKDQHLSVTSVVQDPRTGFENIWYYSSGEHDGTVGGNVSSSIKLYGSGIFKSIDNGETWQQIQSAEDPTQHDSPYDLVSKIIISPVSGSIFIASNFFGVLKSTDGGANFEPSLFKNVNDHTYCEIDVSENGTLLATLSNGLNENSELQPGVYKSINDGAEWTSITPSDDYSNPSRGMIAFAPSNNSVAYLWTDFGDNNTRLYKLNVDNGTFENRTANLPEFGGDVGEINTQGSYNMILEVKPDDENFVLFGATNLYRSFDGFATMADDAMKNWIGGYDIVNDISGYQNHHSDQHSLFFDPSSPDKLWSGHDGGLSYTEDIASTEERINWIDKNKGYNVTQFYHLSISDKADDIRFMGGTQDNGSPFFAFDGNETSESGDVSSGDGSYSYISDNYIFTSSQEGFVQKLPADPGNNGFPVLENYSYIKPKSAEQSLFIHPFEIDRADEKIMYYPDGNKLWRNNSITSVENQSDQGGTDEGWVNIGQIYADESYNITALTSSLAPQHILYVGLTSSSGKAKLIKLNNSDVIQSGFEDISIPDIPEGTYLHQIAVNPEDANEFIVVFPNYNVISIYHTTDGGQTYTPVDGNLEGDNLNPGPSIRNATILNYNSQKVFLLATSVGVFSTTELNGNETIWVQQANDVIGNVVCAAITSRASDGLIAVATHGRGIFAGELTGTVNIDDNKNTPTDFVLEQNYPNPFNPSTKINFNIPVSEHVTLKVYDMLGKEIKALLNERKAPGKYSIDFDGSGLSSGMYLYKLTSGSYSETRKMTLVK